MTIFRKCTTAALFAALAMLAAHNGLGMPWPPVPPASWWEWLYSAIELGAVALCAARALGRPGERLAWLIIALGMLSFAVGDIYYTLVFENAKTVPFPSIDDAFYLACYPACVSRDRLLLRARAPAHVRGDVARRHHRRGRPWPPWHPR